MWKELWPGLRDNALWEALKWVAATIFGSSSIILLFVYQHIPWSQITTVQWGVLALCLLLFVVTMAGIFVHSRAKSSTSRPLTATAAAPASATPTLDWLESEAGAELKECVGRVIVYDRQQPQIRTDAPQPYVDFVVYVYNGSIWPVNAETIEGRVAVDGTEVQGKPEIVLGNDRSISRAEKRKIRIRQWLSREVAEHISSKPDGVNFGLQGVTMLFRVNPDSLHGHPQGRYCRLRLQDQAWR